jgi:hypothetical protein
MQRDPLRLWVSKNLATVTFLGAYFVTTVAGNMIFASPLGERSLKASGSSDRFLDFTHTFTPGFWLLLLFPFILPPPLVAATKRMSAGWIERVSRILPEFSRSAYVSITAACFGFVIYRYWLADVGTLFSSGVDATSSVEARFTIRERIGYITFVPLQALLPFLTVYALIRWINSRELFWAACTLVGTLMLSVLLIMINMKWPVLLFYIGLVLAIFVYSRRRAYLKTAIGGVFLVVAFLLVSTFVWRLAPPPRSSQPGPPAKSGRATPGADSPADSRASDRVSDAEGALSEASERAVATGKAVQRYAPTILLHALNRMAIAYPYYYQIVTEEGVPCGGILAQARRHPSCRPSTLIYQRIHPNDGFENRGTAPLAVHVSGYALGGWPVAVMALVAASLILGLFAALPLDRGSASGAVTILGALVGYHLSQIPGEGVVFYEHGLVWPTLLIAGYVLWQRIISVAKSRIAS